MHILLDILKCKTYQQNIVQITIFYTGSHGTLLGVINSYVHVIMYGYYFMTSYRPELKNSLWWKKHITQVQLVSKNRFEMQISHLKLNMVMFNALIFILQIQFGILVIHFLNPIIFFDCQWPKYISLIGVIQNMFMFILFLDFYIKAYVRKAKKH